MAKAAEQVLVCWINRHHRDHWIQERSSHHMIPKEFMHEDLFRCCCHCGKNSHSERIFKVIARSP